MTIGLQKLTGARAIIEILGGETVVGMMTNVTAKAVNNWANWDEFPAVTYARLMWELNKRGYTASPSLWRQVGCKGLKIRRVK